MIQWKSARRVLVGAAFAAVTLAACTSTPTQHHTAPPPRPITTPAPTTSSVAPKPAIPHETVAAAWPSRFTFMGKGYTITAHVCAMPYEIPFDPPGEQHHTVCYPEERFGSRPGSDSATTYIFGHAWGQDDLEVLNGISSRATEQILKAKPVKVSGIPTYPVTALNGSSIVLHTKMGVLTYRVTSAFGVSKSQAGFVKPLMNQKTKNRLVILTCAERHHTDYDYNVIVYASLYSSVRSQV